VDPDERRLLHRLVLTVAPQKKRAPCRQDLVHPVSGG
jgi:hypothetical protein